MPEEDSMSGPDKAFRELRAIVRRLRAPDGCPWDREQTPASVKKYILEEAYELTEAMDGGDPRNVCEELGDLLFMLLFVAHMFEEAEGFSLEEAMDAIGKKMIRRHPHIFADVQVRDAEEVKTNWQAVKAEECRAKGEIHSVLGNLPKALPALQRAYRAGERASRIGFDWTDPGDVWEKIEEEEQELRQAMKGGSVESIAEELGDLLFSVANLGRLLGINPEDALRRTVERFVERFQTMEQHARAMGRDLSRCSAQEMEGFWSEAKARQEDDVLPAR